MYKKILIGLCFTSMIISLVGCGNNSNKVENLGETTNIESSILEESNAKEDSNINDNEEIITEEISDLGYSTPYDILTKQYGLEPLVVNNTFDIVEDTYVDAKLFYSDEGYSSKHKAFLYIISYLNETFGYDILENAYILKPSQIKEELGISTDMYAHACVILGNKYSKNDVFAIFKIDENVENPESYCKVIKEKMNSFIDKRLVENLDSKEFERISGTNIATISDKYVIMVNLGKDETMNKLAFEDVFHYFSDTGTIAINRISDIIPYVNSGMITDDSFIENHTHSEVLDDVEKKEMTAEEYEEYLNRLEGNISNEESFNIEESSIVDSNNGIIDESATIVDDINDIEQKDAGVY